MEDLKRFPTMPTRGRSLSTSRRTRSYATFAFVGFLLFVLIHLRPLDCLRGPPPKVESWLPKQPTAAAKDGGEASSLEEEGGGTLVPLEAHIMSKCPDARDCLKEMVIPVMQRVYDKVNFTLSFIGSPDGDSGVACKHGPAECMGNILELCAAELYPDPKTYLGFTMCISNDYKEIPGRALVQQCALEHAVDWKKLDDCASRDSGAYGTDLLRNSVERTIKAGVVYSCTVRLDEEVYCIRDSGEWTDCPRGPGVNDLVLTIEKLYRRQAQDLKARPGPA